MTYFLKNQDVTLVSSPHRRTILFLQNHIPHQQFYLYGGNGDGDGNGDVDGDDDGNGGGDGFGIFDNNLVLYTQKIFFGICATPPTPQDIYWSPISGIFCININKGFQIL